MRKIRSIILLALTCIVSTGNILAQPGQYRMGDVFRSMPDSLMPLLSANNRRDMVDFLKNKMEARVRDNLNNYAELELLSDDYLRLKTSANSRTEMKILLTEDSVPIVTLIRTVCAPAADSQVTFYDANWKQLHWLSLPTPSIQDFWQTAPDSLAQDAHYAQLSLQDLRLTEVKAEAERPVFTLVLQTSELAEKEKEAAKLLVHPLQYLWTGRDFRYLDPK